ncbi:DUF4375 domain-containing protein [Pseudoprevotella muciniphila]|uniref:DUF4375 domain-containing protein n=1 Tax=Pseudoprevotella muciniphila TaxID=2133944 RepID=A0A5P8E9A8_9BACT|nr:DMP19 family protein [Pseudoprevotella muciniphila]QFQ13538.1 DUF4375 domain-containing protein [Pseudoprevotella muciniphila]
MRIVIKDSELQKAAQEGMDAFLSVFVKAIEREIDGKLTEEKMADMPSEYITLWAFHLLHEEVMDGGFVQLIVNRNGPFIFFNPFAKVMRLWGLKDLSKLLYRGRELFEKYRDQLEGDFTDEEFMALYETMPEFDDLDDEFVLEEESYVERIAIYIDEHIEDFADIEK